MQELTKGCTKCGVVQPLSKYHIDRRKKSGHGPWCKSCVSDHQRERYERDGEKIRARVNERNRLKREANPKPPKTPKPKRTVCADCGERPPQRKRSICNRCIEKKNPRTVTFECQHCHETVTKPRQGKALKYCSRACSDEAKRKEEAPYTDWACHLSYCVGCSAVIPRQGRKTCGAKECLNRNASLHVMKQYYEIRDAGGIPPALHRHHLKRASGVGKYFNDEIYERDSWICHLCDEPIDVDAKWPAPLSRSIDHVIPVSKGGEHTAENIKAAHLRCNISKGNRTVD